MSIATVVTRGFGTFGTASLVVTRGYAIAEVTFPPLYTVALSCRYEPTVGLVCINEATLLLACSWEPTVDLTASYESVLPLHAEVAMIAFQDLLIFRAADYTLRFTMDHPRSVLGWAVTWSMKYKSGGTALIAKTVGSGVTLTDSTRGVISVAILKANTSSLTPSAELPIGESYIFDLKRTDSGANTVLAYGPVELVREVTA